MASSTPSLGSSQNPASTTEPLFNNSTKYESLEINTECDILIIGSGAAGLLAALRTHSHGLTPLIVEKTAFLGGTSALSGGSVWIPNNHVTLATGNKDSLHSALTYMTASIGDVGPVSSLARKMAFLAQGPKMVQWLSDLGFKWVAAARYPDYYQENEGASPGRSIEGAVFDAKRLGEWERLLADRKGQSSVALHAGEANVFPVFKRTWGLFFLFWKIVLLRTVGWKLLGRRPVTMGKSLVAQLMLLVKNRGLRVWRETPLVKLIVEDGKVVGAVVRKNGKEIDVRAKGGVILCAGGFARNLEMRGQYFQEPASDEWTAVPASDTGDAIQAGQTIGAASTLMDDASWYPTFVNLKTGERRIAPFERCLPHGIIVDSTGQRFMNEAQSYSNCGQDQYKRDKAVSAIPAWLIMDSQHRKKYMLLSMLPGKTPESAFADGLLKRGASLNELANEIGVEMDGLLSTVSKFNEMVARGVDDDFNRGKSIYDQYFGDPTMKPNPNLGTLQVGPYYAIQIWPGDLGTKGGLLTDEHARVLRKNGEVISGLYAAGNTSASIMGRSYPGPGSTLGPAMTFAFIAVDHAASDTRTR